MRVRRLTLKNPGGTSGRTERWRRILPVLILATLLPPAVSAREPDRSQPGLSSAAIGQPAAREDVLSELSERERLFLERLQRLEKRIAYLESRLGVAGVTAATDPPPLQEAASGKANEWNSRYAVASPASDPVPNFLRGTSFNVTLDGYYGYNFNRPVGRINLLRAYDVMSNSFSLNQAALIIERPPDVEAGGRFGLRLDLQYGQATETMQGSAASEIRPQAYRPIFQAYGTYVAPLGKGLAVDFGKWAGALSVEGNYTKDQMNYSRSFFYTFSPFYHVGFRTGYDLTPKLRIEHWLVNGAQQSEDFNGFKSQALLLTVRPASGLSWNLNYYTGIEGRDSAPDLNPGLPALPTQPGISTNVIRPAPRGRLHIADSYAIWNAGRLTLAGQAFFVINRDQTFLSPSRVTGGGAWARYQFTPKFGVAGRAEYLSDRGGLFSGLSQALKETTLTADYHFAEGFLVRSEWRRDFSNQPFFLANDAGTLKKEQNTATLGLVWWFGGKQGAW